MRRDCSIKKPKTYRYPSLNGTDPKFRRNHKHSLHGTMKALVSVPFTGGHNCAEPEADGA